MSKIERIVLHIGKHKTGSSSIQASLFGANLNGFRYADLPRANHARAMMAFSERLLETSNTKKQQFTEQRVERGRREILEILDRALAAPARTLLFSAEVLENFSHEDVGNLVAYLRNHTGRIEVVGFVRPPVAAQISTFQERVKHGYFRPILPGIRYRKSFAPYIDYLGPDAVTILPFDPKTFRNGSLLETFLHAIGEPELPIEEKRSNEGMPGAATKFMYAFNRIEHLQYPGKQNYGARQKMWRMLSEGISGPKLTLPEECYFLGALEDEVVWLKSFSGIDFSGDLARMSGDRRRVSKALLHEMANMDEEAMAQLYALTSAATSRQPDSVQNAVSDLYRALGGREQVH